MNVLRKSRKTPSHPLKDGHRVSAKRSPSPSRNRGTAREKVHYIEPYAGCSCDRDIVAATEYPHPDWPEVGEKLVTHTSAPAHEDLPHRRIVRWLSAYFLVPNWHSRAL